MASRTKTKIVHRAPSVPKKRYEMAVRAATATRTRAKRVASERIGTLVGCGTAYVVGKVEKSGKKLPSVLGVEGTALWGAAFAFGPSVLGMGAGRLGTIFAEAGSSMLGIACYKAGKGIAPIVAGEDDEAWQGG
jgi:hypothetical protein